MIDFIEKKITGKNLLILGYGREGESTYRLLRKYFPQIEISIADLNPEIKNRIKDVRTNIISGENYSDAISEYDLIIKSPGISLNHLPLQIPREKITSQTDLFLQFYSRQIIGVTGTKGKSTTSSLIFHCIKLFSDNVVLVGNIGVPPFDRITEINDKTKIVYELSSHQLEYVSKSPHIAILLNLFQEHLDHYKTYKDYQLAKFNIVRHQQSSDYFIHNSDDKLIKKLISEFNFKINYYACSLINNQTRGCSVIQNKVLFSDDDNHSELLDLHENIFLKGEHNIRNIMAAISACKILSIPDDIITNGIRTFKGLEHRLEFVGEYNGILFYNDSIATIPEATIEAIKTLKKVETLILGGFDRGVDYSSFAEFLIASPVNNLLFIGDAGKRMLNCFPENIIKNKNISLENSFQNAVRKARHITRPKGICLLSPAAASYDLFRNFEERGNEFKKLVRD